MTDVKHREEPASSSWWSAVDVCSRKGYGPFSSGTSRLSTQVAYTGPGPGSYTPDLIKTKSATNTIPSAAFGTAARACGRTGDPGSTAGPGAHFTALEWTAVHTPGAAAAFKSPSRSASASASTLRERLQQQKYQQGQSAPWLLAPPHTPGGRPHPGPRSADLAHRQQQQTSHQQGQHSAHAGRAGQQRRMQSASSGPHGTFSAASCPTFMLPGLTPSPSGGTTPGPGSYDLLQYGSLRNEPHTHHSMFAKPLAADRFGVSTLQKHDRYHQQQQQRREQRHVGYQEQQQQQQQQQRRGAAGLRTAVLAQQPGVSAPFRSASPGHSEVPLAAADPGLLGAPGPSYYNAQPMPAKVSFRSTQALSRRTFVAAV